MIMIGTLSGMSTAGLVSAGTRPRSDEPTLATTAIAGPARPGSMGAAYEEMRQMRGSLCAGALALSLLAGPVQAQEVFGGVYAHAVDTPFTFDTGEGGVDIQAGVRTDPIERLALIGKPSAHLFGSVNTRGDTSFVAAGLSWKVDLGPAYLRPGIGLALHDAPSRRVDPVTRLRTDLGSRVLFEPEMALGTQLSERVSIELSWVHISNARLFDSKQNPGIDMMGVRMNLRL
jgi:lipid A 3-O-deacylase